jgi:photosystem II stability/assembly factor-like uncharacterized protein
MILLLLALLDVFSSSDGGKTWKPAGLAGKAIDELVADSKDPLVAYAFVGGDVMNRSELHRTADGGKTWTKLDPGVDLHCIAIDPADSKTLLVGGREGAYAKSTDAGKNWTKGEISVAGGGFGRKNVRGMAFLGKTIVAAGGQGDGFIGLSTDGGATWTKPETSLGYAWACAVADKAILVGGDSGLLVSIDGGKSFEAKGGLEEQPGVGGRFSLSRDGKKAFFSFRGACVISDDGGKTWTPAAGPDKGSTIQAMAWSGSTMIATALTGKEEPKNFPKFQPDGGAFIATSGDGKTWTKVATPGTGKATIVAASPDGKLVWLGTR